MPTSNAELLARRQLAVPRGVAHATSIFAAAAENAELWDVEGRRYIDFAGDIAVLNTGHRHPKVIAAVERQLALYTHTAFQVAPYEPYIALCERLNHLAPFSGPAKTLLVNSGAEAVENATKIARAATGRPGLIAFSGAFHGRTLMTMGLTGKVAPYKKKAGPMPPEIYHIPVPAPSLGVTIEGSLKALAQLFKADIDPERVAVDRAASKARFVPRNDIRDARQAAPPLRPDGGSRSFPAPRAWVRTVLSETPPAVVISSTASPALKLRATRASAGVRSNSDCTSATGGACGSINGVITSTPAQRTKISRAIPRIGTTCATIAALVSALRTAKDRTGPPPSRSRVVMALCNSASASTSLSVIRPCAPHRMCSVSASIKAFAASTRP